MTADSAGHDGNDRSSLAPLGGDVVKCSTPEDAAAVTLANEMLQRIVDPRDYPLEEIWRLGDVLRRYGRHRAAETLLCRVDW